MRGRALKLVRQGIVPCLAIILYLIFHNLTHLALFCPFHKFFHLFCPGCGSTRFLLAIMRGDLVAAFYANSFLLAITRGDLVAAFYANSLLFVLSPFYLAIFLYQSYRYIRYNDRDIRKPVQYFLYFTIILFVIFGIIRNLFPTPPLAPS